MPAAAVGEDAVVTVIALEREAEAAVEGLAGVEIACGDDSHNAVIRHTALRIDGVDYSWRNPMAPATHNRCLSFVIGQNTAYVR